MDDTDRSRPSSRTLDENDNPRSYQRRRIHEEQQGSRLADYPEEAPHQFGTQLHTGNLSYQSEYPSSGGHRQPQNQQPFSPFTPNMLYNIPQTSTVHSSHYGNISAFPAHRQNAAIEVLSSQFAGVPQYYVPDSSGASVPSIGTTHQQQSSQSQYPPLSYGQPSTAPRLTQSFTSNIHELTQPSTAVEPVAEGGFTQQNQSSAAMDDAYNRYQTALRATFQNMRDGRLGEAGASLLVLSDWLLTNAVDLVVLGLVRDEQELQGDRTRLWNEFNICWLSVLAKEKEMIREMTATGQPPQPPREILREDFLDRMGTEIIRLCDGMERHGLVDYQMGVWEEEIVDSITECLDLLAAHYDARPSQPSN